MDMKVDEAARLAGGAEALHRLAAGSSVSIRYHPLFGPHDDLLLLEVDEKLLPDILRHGVTVRGQPDEEAVLCTSSATYAMKFVGTSNSVFLIPPGESPALSNVINQDSESKEIHPDSESSTNVSGLNGAVSSVLKVATGNMELILVAPRLEKLKILLSERPYRLEEDTEADKRGLYTWTNLLEQIQASEQELLDGLKSLAAVELNGFWRILDTKTMDEILNMILHNSLLHGWSLNALAEDEVLPTLEADGYPCRIVQHCLEAFGTKTENQNQNLWRLENKPVSLRFAMRLLSEGPMNLESFIDKWTRSIPSGMHAELKMLEGEVLYEKLGIETWIRPFSISALPSTPAERFAALFQERPRWQWKDLDPYVRDLRAPGLSSEGLLIKYTRRIQPSADVEPIFCAR